MKKHLLWILPLALLALLFILAPLGKVTVPVNVHADDTNTSMEADLPAATATIEYAGQEGKTAFELLQATHEVSYDQFDFGVLVNSIDGQESDANHFWLYYINGDQPTVGADQYTTTDSDTILWRLEESTM